MFNRGFLLLKKASIPSLRESDSQAFVNFSTLKFLTYSGFFHRKSSIRDFVAVTASGEPLKIFFISFQQNSLFF
tara:strand:+ start:486 stop:707 length:222 start_codon:yes stop_codon:yes gene_type:complete